MSEESGNGKYTEAQAHRYNRVAEFLWSLGDEKYEAAAVFIRDNPDFYEFWRLFMMMAILRDMKEKQKTDQAAGSVYFLQDDTSGNVKVGYTKGCAVRRTNQIKGMNHTPLTLLFHIKADKRSESALHKVLRGSNVHHEWFEGVAVKSLITHLEELKQNGEMLTKERVEGFAELIGKTLIPSAQFQIGEK